MTDVLIIGSGIAGLTAATILGTAGKSVLLLDQAEKPGGRAASQTTVDGFHFNMGPHALYLAGHANRVLRQLDIDVDGRKVGTSGAYTVYEGTLHTFPSGPVSLFSSGIFSLPEAIETLRFLTKLGSINVAPLASTTVTDWLTNNIRSERVRLFVQALIRVSSYCNAPDQMSAGAAIEQLQAAFRGGVAYLNGGWQTLVDQLRRRAEMAGAVLRPASRVHSIEYGPDGAEGVRLDDGTRLAAGAVVLAVPPASALTLLGDGAGSRLRQWISASLPAQAACLDLALRQLPKPQRTFALGLDEPLYFSVHSRWADLAPKGAALIHVAKYLPETRHTDPAADREELERYMDLVQPGWRNHVVHQRFMPRIAVTQTIVRARDGGLQGRPAVDAPAAANVFLAGDWVGSEGMLADAAFASASRAAQMVITTPHSMLQAV